MFVVNDIRIGWVAVCKVGIATTPSVKIHMLPRVLAVPLDEVITWSEQSGIVLCSAVDVVGRIHVDTNGVELADWQVIDMKPRFTAVVRDVQASIVTKNEMLWIFGINP